jgi:hypothetical protein
MARHEAALRQRAIDKLEFGDAELDARARHAWAR